MQHLSFEFFPPQTEEGLNKLTQTAQVLSDYNPEFFSVTFGAGGSTQDRSFKTVDALLKTTEVPVAPHLSCIGATQEKLSKMLTEYKSLGVQNVVALRGDMPSGLGVYQGELRHAKDLVELIRHQNKDDFTIDVAVYPECHPETSCLPEDLDYFKQKVEAGADRAITQYFYNADAYAHLLEQCEKRNINIPVVPGVMPITNYKQLARFSDNCGAEIPRWIRKTLEAYGDDLESIRQFGIEVVTRLCERLLDYGAPGFHFYTLNKVFSCQAILNNIK